MKEQKLLILNQDFKTWCKSERRNNYLNKADKIGNTIFKKPFDECFTYEKNYILKMIVRGTHGNE